MVHTSLGYTYKLETKPEVHCILGMLNVRVHHSLCSGTEFLMYVQRVGTHILKMGNST